MTEQGVEASSLGRGALDHMNSTSDIKLSREQRFMLGALAADPPSCEVERGGVRETLEPRVMQVLVLLARESGTVVSREDLITHCWDGRIVSENAVNRVLSRIRALAAGLGTGSFAIQTFPKIGYRLVTLDAVPDASSPIPLAPVPTQRLPTRRTLVAGGVAALGSAGVLGWQGMWFDPAPAADATLYRKGVEAQRQGLVEQNIQAMAFFREAVAESPSDPLAWGALSLSYRHLLETGSATKLAAIAAQSRSAAARALELDPRNADATVTLIIIPPYFRNWLSMEAALRDALKKYPAHWLLWGNIGRILGEVGRWREAATVYDHAVALDPFLPITRACQAATLWGGGRLQEADTAYARAAARWPAHPAIWFGRFRFLALSGRPAEAIALAEQRGARPIGIPEAAFTLGTTLAKALAEGRSDTIAAVRAIREGVTNGVQSIESAVQYLSALGAADVAFAMLDGYYFGERDGSTGRRRPMGPLERRYTDFLFTPPTEPLRRDARFAALTAAIGLDRYWASSHTRPD